MNPELLTARLLEDGEDLDPKAYVMGFETYRSALERTVTIEDEGIKPQITWEWYPGWRQWQVMIRTGKQVNLDAALHNAGIHEYQKIRGSRGRTKNWAKWYVYLDERNGYSPDKLVKHET